MATDRRLDVLRAIVSQYVHTREPVGSKMIAATQDLGVSPATIRNDMAVLEENDLIYQPHTSAGRVPTEKGYRLFVDTLSEIKPMSAPEKRAIETFLGQCVDLEDVVNRTVRLLAQVTRQVAVVQYPSLSTSTLLRVELVDLAPHRVLLIVITNEGRVEERMLEFPQQVPPHVISFLREKLNDECENHTADKVRTIVDEIRNQAPSGHQNFVDAVCSALTELLHPTAAESRVVIAGMSHLTRSHVDFTDIGALLDALEEHVVLLRLLSELDEEHFSGDVHVSIGTENPDGAFAETSVISGTYGTSSGAVAHLGVIGPTRMDYGRTMSTVRAVASYLSKYLAS